jgi:hypothetical protein
VPNPLKLAHAATDIMFNGADPGKRLETVFNAQKSFEDDKKFGKALVTGFIEPYKESWSKGKYFEVAGRAFFDVGSMLVGGGEANAVAKGSKVAAEAEKAAEIANVASKAGKVTEGASTAGKVTEVANVAGKTAEAANVVDKVADTGKGAKAAEATSAADKTADIGRAESEVRYMKGKPAKPLEKTYELAMDKQAYASAIAKKYRINLKGTSGKVKIVIDNTLRPGVKGVTKYREGGNVIHISEQLMIEGDEAAIANTIAHELSHARDFQRGHKAGMKSLEEAEAKGFEKPHGYENSPAGDGSVYGSGHALEEYIRGKR